MVLSNTLHQKYYLANDGSCPYHQYSHTTVAYFTDQKQIDLQMYVKIDIQIDFTIQQTLSR